MLEVPEDFNYDITPTPYGMSLSVTIEKPDAEYRGITPVIGWEFDPTPPWIDETLF